MTDVVVLGEAMVLLVARELGPLAMATTFDKRTAGAETNVAVGLARLGHRVAWQSRLGDDSLGRYLAETFQAEGIDTSRVVFDAAQRTGLMFKGRVDDGSDPPIEYHRRGSAASLLQPDEIDAAWLTRARHLHVTGIFPALAPNTLAATRRAMTLMREAGRSVSFDPNLRPALWSSARVMRDTLDGLARLAHWVLPGLDEGRQLTGHTRPADIAAHYRALGATHVAVKLGAEGVWLSAPDGDIAVPAWPAPQVVDTVGAGDGFAAGFISALLEGRPAVEAARRGAWIGARAVQVRGDTEGLPTQAELASAFPS